MKFRLFTGSLYFIQKKEKHMKKSIFIIFLLWCLISAPALSASDSYIVGIGDYEYYPHQSHSEKGYTGFSRDVLDMFGQKKEIKLKYKVLPLNRVHMEYFTDKTIDFIFPDNSVWDTDKKNGITVYYSNPVVQYTDGVMVLSENKGKGLRYLKKLGTLRGFTPFDYLNLINSGQIQLRENSKFIPLLQQVLLKRIDGAYIEISVARYNLHEKLKTPDALLFDPDLPHTTDYYYLSSIKHPYIIKKFNDFLHTEQDAVNRLKEKYKVGALNLEELSSQQIEKTLSDRKQITE